MNPCAEGAYTNKPVRVRAVEPLPNFTLRVTFTNDEQRDIAVWRYIERGPIFEPVRNDPAFFQMVQVENNTVSWPNGADIDPDTLYLGLRPHATEEEWRAAKEAATLVQH
jgi:hypothetical protein